MIKRLIPLAAFLLLSSVTNAQDSTCEITLVDGVVTLNRTFNQLAGIQVSAADGGLSNLDFEIAPGVFVPPSKAPFPFTIGIIAQDTPEQSSLACLVPIIESTLKARPRRVLPTLEQILRI